MKKLKDPPLIFWEYDPVLCQPQNASEKMQVWPITGIWKAQAVLDWEAAGFCSTEGLEEQTIACASWSWASQN